MTTYYKTLQKEATMKKITATIAGLIFLCNVPAHAGFLDDVMGTVEKVTNTKTTNGDTGMNQETIVAGLKEALQVGTGKAVTLISKNNGYFGNNQIKIQMPEKIRLITDTLRKYGFDKQVNDFELSMNRAAEKAAPKAKKIVVNAVKAMSFADAKKILNGGKTAATDYLQSKTSEQLFAEFKPSISSSMNKVGVARYYKAMMSKVDSLPYMPTQSVDVDNYVTDKALAGFFFMLGQEEKAIRENPTARVTDLLKQVFTK